MEVKYPILEWRMGIRQFGISDLGCSRMEEVLRAPAAHGVSTDVDGVVVSSPDRNSPKPWKSGKFHGNLAKSVFFSDVPCRSLLTWGVGIA